ncbi:hypothetical protein GQ53DRAFT_740962 [Thozetella sp. PMI_491]|nr:hypothetical protein GQ53DRAFT_740962 [Thozetella sp. PMI_491]
MAPVAPVDLYDASIGLLISGNNSLLNILKKGSEAANAESLPSARLYEDMLPLTTQVTIASNTSKKAVERLTSKTPGVWEDNEKTFPELIARVEKTLELLKSVDRSEFKGVETKTVELGLGPGKNVEVQGEHYVFAYAIPNFFFHLNTAYGILRANGVPLGKRDYLGSFMAPYIPAAP